MQPKGFSPVCDIPCFWSVPECEKALPQREQENGLSPVCDLIWVFNVTAFEKDLPQKEQASIMSIVFEIWCLVSSPEMMILVSSIFGRGSADTTGQVQQCTVS